jgi:6-phosphogluconate dehydrogenase
MPGCTREVYDLLEPIISKCAAQVDDGPCTTYLGPIGSGNYVKMVHNGIEYGISVYVVYAKVNLHVF